jgi:hypothetical protein
VVSRIVPHTAALAIEAAEQGYRFLNGQLVGQPRLLQLCAHPLPQFPLIAVPTEIQHANGALIRLQQPLNHLYCRGLARTIRPQHTKALSFENLEIESVYGQHRTVPLHDAVARHSCLGHTRNQRRQG